METVYQKLARGKVEIDHDVTAEDEVERSSKGILFLEEVQPSVLDHLPEPIGDAVISVLETGETRLQLQGGDSGHPVRPIFPPYGMIEHFGRNVRREDLGIPRNCVYQIQAIQRDGQGVGFFPRGRRRAPDAKPAHALSFFLGDEAGQKGAQEIASALADQVWVRVVACPEGKDPEELSDDELEELVEQLDD